MNITNIIRGSSTFYYLCVAVVSVYWKLLSPKQIPYMQTFLYIYNKALSESDSDYLIVAAHKLEIMFIFII